MKLDPLELTVTVNADSGGGKLRVQVPGGSPAELLDELAEELTDEPEDWFETVEELYAEETFALLEYSITDEDCSGCGPADDAVLVGSLER